MAGVHVRADVEVAKRVGEHLVRATNPAAIERVLPVVHAAPTNASGLKLFRCPDDGLGDSGDEIRSVIRIHPAAETGHRRRRRMRVRGGDKHFIHRNTRGLTRLFLRTVNHAPRHHAGVHHCNDETRFAVIKRERTDFKWIGGGFCRTLREHRVDAHRIVGRSNIHHRSTGAESPALSSVSFIDKDGDVIQEQRQ